jgi:hypothetical protein
VLVLPRQWIGAGSQMLDENCFARCSARESRGFHLSLLACGTQRAWLQAAEESKVAITPNARLTAV